MNKFPVLMYHRIVSERCPVPHEDVEETRYSVSLADFTWQLDRLMRHGRVCVSMEQVVECLASGREIPREWVAVTFDDGNESDYVHALPILSERSFSATFFVCGNRVDTPGGLTRTMIRELAFAGLHVGAHGMTHRFLTTLDAEEEESELVQSRELLGEIIDGKVDHFAPPGGRYSERTVATLRRLSYKAVCTSRPGFNQRSGDRFEFYRVPITAGTGRGQFDAIATGAALRLAPMFVRSRMLSWLRRGLGENSYRRLRALGMRK